jgi:hypothetical protein
MPKTPKTLEERLVSIEELLRNKCQDCGALVLDDTKHRLFHDTLKASQQKMQRPFQGGFR